MMLPQELEVWYVIPAIRKELAGELSKLKVKHKDIAKLFGVTEACVSNYFKSKRAGEVKFAKGMKSLIKQSANRLNKKESCFIKEIQLICREFKNKKHLCSLHEKFDTKVCKCRGCLA